MSFAENRRRMTVNLMTELSRDELEELPYTDIRELHKLRTEKKALISALEHEFSRTHLKSASVQDLRKLAETTESVVLKFESEIEKEVETELEGAFAGLKNLARMVKQSLGERFSGLIHLYRIMRNKL